MVLYSRYPVRFDLSNSAIRGKCYVSPPGSALDAPRDWLHLAPMHEAHERGHDGLHAAFGGFAISILDKRNSILLQECSIVGV